MQGELRCQIITDFPDRFSRTKQAFLGEDHLPITITRARVDRGRVLLKLDGVDSRTAAEGLVGRTVYIPEEEAVSLPSGTYFWHQIIGLTVRLIDGEELGQVTQILETGSNDVYVVTGPRGEVLIPATAEVVHSIDVGAGLITITPLEGLF